MLDLTEVVVGVVFWECLTCGIKLGQGQFHVPIAPLEEKEQATPLKVVLRNI